MKEQAIEKEKNTSAELVYEEIDLVELVKPIVKNFKILIIVPLVGALIFGLISYLFSPHVYKSSVDLVVTSPYQQTEKQNPYNVYFFKNILESSSFLFTVTKKAQEKGFLKKGADLKLDRNVLVSIFTSAGKNTAVLSPIIRVSVLANNPQNAYNILKLLVDTLLKEANQTVLNMKANFIVSAEKEFPKIKTNYENILKEYNDIKNKYLISVNLKEAENKNTLDKFDLNAAKQVMEFEKERKQQRLKLVRERQQGLLKLKEQRKEQRSELESKLHPEIIEKQFDEVQKEYNSKKAQLKFIDSKLFEKRIVLKNLKKMIAETPEKLVLNSKGLLFKKTHEQVNPNYLNLASKIQAVNQEIIQLEAKKENISQNLTSLEKQYNELMKKNNDNQRILNQFDVETENQVALYEKETENLLNFFDTKTDILKKKLQDNLDLQRQKIKNKLDEELAQLKANFELKLTSLKNNQLYLENSFKELANRYSEAIVMKSENYEPIKILSPPYIPSKPEPRGTVFKTIIVGLLLGFLMLVFVYLKEFYFAHKDELLENDK